MLSLLFRSVPTTSYLVTAATARKKMAAAAGETTGLKNAGPFDLYLEYFFFFFFLRLIERRKGGGNEVPVEGAFNGRSL